MTNYNNSNDYFYIYESKVTEIYCIVNDFCKEFVLQQKKYMIEAHYVLRNFTTA